MSYPVDPQHAARVQENVQSGLAYVEAKKIVDQLTAPREDWSQPDPILGFDAPRPYALLRDDGKPLGYADGYHCLWGVPGAGKSWLAALWATREVQRGRPVYWIDFEGQRKSIGARLRACGLDDGQITGYIRYKAPMAAPDMSTFRYAAANCVVVIDGFQGLMAKIVPGGSSNSSDDVDACYNQVIEPLVSAGCLVLAIDHPPKDRPDGSDAPQGSQRKLGTMDAGYNLVKKPSGAGFLYSRKDRNGTFEKDEELGYLVFEDGRPMLTADLTRMDKALDKAPGERKLSPAQQVVRAVADREAAVQKGIERSVHTKRTLRLHLAEHGTPRKSETWWREQVDGVLENGHLITTPGPNRAEYVRTPTVSRGNPEETSQGDEAAA